MDGEPVLFLHGNLASSTFWEETMLTLPSNFRAVAPDLRGYGLTDPSVRIDATRGVAEWVEDAVALADAFGWDRFHVVAHSLGGGITWGMIARYSDRIASVTLVAPGPPCGFGGAKGARGELNHNDGAGSGAGLALAPLLEYLAHGKPGEVSDVFSPRGVMNRLYWKPPFRPSREDQLVTAMLQVHLGDDRLPGDKRPSSHWPGFAPGVHGPINAMSPLYNQWVLPELVDADIKPRLLWIYGAADPVICNRSPSDPGTQGKLGIRSDWPGAEEFPPQPLLDQVNFALDQYAQHGGVVTRQIMAEVGHTPYLERPAEFQRALASHLTQPSA
jgi:pimeloyl-ACP methyl ester carboxylesterase